MNSEELNEQLPVVQSFIRGLEVIKTFGEGAAKQSLSDVANRASISRASARRLLHTLCDQGFARTDGKLFWLTPRILELGFSYLSSMDIWSFAQSYMEDLVQRVHESCSIAVLDGYDIYYVMRVPTRKLLKSTLNIGSSLPAHVVSLGRIQLAALSDEELEHFLDTAKIEQYTPFTITDREALRQAIRDDGAKGWSLVDRELEEGMYGISVPIHNRHGKTVAAINITLPPSKGAEPGMLDYLLGELQETALCINNELARRQ